MPSYTKRVKVPGKNAQELYDKVASEIEKFLARASIGKFDIARDPHKKEVSFKNPMVTAHLVCMDECLELDAKLSLMAAPFRSKIDEGIEKWIAKAFG